MTRRERMERRLERRREWAAGRNAKAARLLAANEPFRGDIAFNTQPGHIPERARAIAREDKAAEHYEMAQHHGEVAATLEARLGRDIFSDDADAVAHLEARIAEREAERQRLVSYNASCRAAAKRGEAHGDLSLLDEAQRRELASLLRVASYQVRPGGAFPAYALSNLGGRIRADRERIAEIRTRQAATRAAEVAGGVLVERAYGSEWCRVVFADKPDRPVLEALRAAGFRWGGGAWSGRWADLPPEVKRAAGHEPGE